MKLITNQAHKNPELSVRGNKKMSDCKVFQLYFDFLLLWKATSAIQKMPENPFWHLNFVKLIVTDSTDKTTTFVCVWALSISGLAVAIIRDNYWTEIDIQ